MKKRYNKQNIGNISRNPRESALWSSLSKWFFPKIPSLLEPAAFLRRSFRSLRIEINSVRTLKRLRLVCFHRVHDAFFSFFVWRGAARREYLSSALENLKKKWREGGREEGKRNGPTNVPDQRRPFFHYRRAVDDTVGYFVQQIACQLPEEEGEADRRLDKPQTSRGGISYLDSLRDAFERLDARPQRFNLSHSADGRRETKSEVSTLPVCPPSFLRWGERGSREGGQSASQSPCFFERGYFAFLSASIRLPGHGLVTHC